jgi:hypothetical protein
MLLMQGFQLTSQNYRPNAALQALLAFYVSYCNYQKKEKLFFYFIITTVHFPPHYIFHFAVPYLVSSLFLPEGQAGTFREPSE